jgi:hypothetical protein
MPKNFPVATSAVVSWIDNVATPGRGDLNPLAAKISEIIRRERCHATEAPRTHLAIEGLKKAGITDTS